MERMEVISVLQPLANGVDPTTGEAVHEVFAAPNVIRALFAAVDLLKQGQQRAQPAAAGARWTVDEDAMLGSEFDQGTPISEIATRHGRTKGAITSRLVRIGRIDAAEVQMRDRSAPVQV